MSEWIHVSYSTSAIGWDASEKAREMFDASSRFILVYCDGNPAHVLTAFLMFRFDIDECTESDEIAWFASNGTNSCTIPGRETRLQSLQRGECADDEWDEERHSDLELEVAYLYELQISSAFQRIGLGTFLVRALEAIAKSAKMAKTILTVFLANKNAISFYERRGYVTALRCEEYVTVKNACLSHSCHQLFTGTQSIRPAQV